MPVCECCKLTFLKLEQTFVRGKERHRKCYFFFLFLIPFLLKLESDALHIGNWVIKTHHDT